VYGRYEKTELIAKLDKIIEREGRVTRVGGLAKHLKSKSVCAGSEAIAAAAREGLETHLSGVALRRSPKVPLPPGWLCPPV
jgi:hypothetical protein